MTTKENTKKNNKVNFNTVNNTVNNSILPIYKKLVEDKKETIIQQCYDFSLISPSSKKRIDDLLYAVNYTQNQKLVNLNDIVPDSFFLLKKLFRYYEKHNHSDNLKQIEKVYLYSIRHVRELLFLCSQYYINENTTLFDKLQVSVSLEKINLTNHSVNPNTIHQIVNSLAIDYICVDIKKP